MIPLAAARRTVLQGLAPLPPRRLPVPAASGCVLAEAVVAGRAVPSFANSAMDGYAVRAADTRCAPCRLRVVGTVLAGDAPEVVVGPGEAARIMTGAVLPDGADAVCMVERTTAGPDATVVVEEMVTVGQHVRRPGEDVAVGQRVFGPGAALSPAHIGVLSALGVAQVTVHPRPSVAVLSTGNELVDGPGVLAPGQIHDSNRPALLAALAADGFLPVDLGVLADDEELVEAAFRAAASEHDAVVTSGGVSVGDRDVVRLVLQRLGDDAVRWMQVAIKPAKPLAFGRLGRRRTPVFGLPGNPVSALVSYELFVRPALRALAGHRRLDRAVLQAVAAEAVPRQPDGKVHLVRVTALATTAGTIEVTPVPGQGSHQLRAMAEANALAVVPDGTGVTAGANLSVLLLDPGALPATGRQPLGGGPVDALEVPGLDVDDLDGPPTGGPVAVPE